MLTIPNDDTLPGALDRLILRHGALRVLWAFVRRMLRKPRVARPIQVGLSNHLLRDIGLPPEPEPPPDALRHQPSAGHMLAAPRPHG